MVWSLGPAAAPQVVVAAAVLDQSLGFSSEAAAVVLDQSLGFSSAGAAVVSPAAALDWASLSCRWAEFPELGCPCSRSIAPRFS